MQLVEKLDASDARLDHLDAIERGLADLLIQMEAPAHVGPRSGGIANTEVDALKRDVQRTQDTLETVHGTLGHVVDRLATIETSIRDNAPSRAVTIPEPARIPEFTTAPAVAPPAIGPAEPVASLQDIPLSPPVAPTQSAMFRESPVADTPAGPKVNPAPASDRRPIDPDLPPDHPLEPGAGRSRGGNSPAERIAASEAALENVRPPVIPDPAGKSNFIAAARRAAQAAIVEAPLPKEKPAPAPMGGDAGKSSLTGKFGGIRKLMVGAGVILFILGALHFASTRFWFGTMPAEQATHETPVAEPPTVTAPPASDRQSSALPSGFSMAPNAFGIDSLPTAPATTSESGPTGALYQPIPQADVMPSAGPALLPQTPPALADAQQ